MLAAVAILILIYFLYVRNKSIDDPVIESMSTGSKRAVCFGGGGWAAATGELALINYLCGVKKTSVKDLLKKIGTFAGNSGGTYTLLLLFYSATFNKNHLDYDSNHPAQETRMDNFYDWMKDDVNLWQVLGLLDVDRFELNWTHLLIKGLNKYGPDITKRFLDEPTSAGSGKEIIFNTSVNSQGIFYNAKGATVGGSQLVKPKTKGETLVINTEITVPTVTRKKGDPVISFAQARFIGTEGNQKQPIFVFPGKIESSIEVEEGKFGTPNSKVLQTNTLTMGDTLYDVSKVRAIDAAGASSGFFGLIENPDFVKELSEEIVAEHLGHNMATKAFKIISNESQSLFKPGVTMGAAIKDKDVILTPFGGQKLASKLNKDTAYLKLCDGGYIDNSAVATTLKRLQDTSELSETLDIIFVDGASEYPGKNWKWSGVVDHIFGLDKRTFSDYGGLWDQRWPPGAKAKSIPFPMPTTHCMTMDKMTYNSGMLANKSCEEYSRGTPYIWKLGDSAFSSSEARDRCRKENSQGCDSWGSMWYPKCKDGTEPGWLPWQCNCPDDANQNKEETWLRLATFECTTIANPWYGIKPGQRVRFTYYQTNATGTSMLPINLKINELNWDVSNMFDTPKRHFREVAKIIEANKSVKQKLLELF